MAVYNAECRWPPNSRHTGVVKSRPGRVAAGNWSMSEKTTKQGSVTVERSGARSVNLGQVLNTERAQAQLKEIQKIERSQSGPKKHA